MDRRVLKTKEAIKTAYKELVIEKNSTKITITEIAKKANIDRKTFYLHYNTIDSVLQEITVDNLSELTDLLEENNYYDHPREASVILQHLNTSLMKDMDFFERMSNSPDFQLFVADLKEITVQKSIEKMSASTDLSTEEITVYTRFVISGIIDVYANWFQNKTPITIDELSQITSKIIENGLHHFIL